MFSSLCNFSNSFLIYEFAETPPAKTNLSVFICFIAFFVFSIKISVTVFSKLAHKLALFILGSLWFKFITAVFIPLKLKSKLSK